MIASTTFITLPYKPVSHSVIDDEPIRSVGIVNDGAGVASVGMAPNIWEKRNL